MKPKTTSLLIALGLAILFLIRVLGRASVFNLIPYSIHEAIWPGGSNESIFIKVFDIICAFIIFFIGYKISYYMLRKNRS
jgi:hypothetical protein